ncbi:ADD91334.1 follistatin [Lates japonicus]|uniref:ADD91334.1 follistatin n=1 Tax=Lates japonicus TaxID=270547 RepID=A0AAD3MHX5_LATJO|nr:ADD91334.1 follistatin [Lates japonicus]GLD54868.1 ADD91334.1 follistatin [Lates japonicus]
MIIHLIKDFPCADFFPSLFAEAKSCEDIQCSVGKKCLWDARMSRGRCSLCDETCPESRTDEAVCASDNTTYPSECAMKQAACSMGVLLEVKHSGSCNCK